MSSKNYSRWKQKKQKSAEDKEEVSAELQEQQKLDPRVNVFLRHYEYSPDQTDPMTICMTQQQLRNMFQAYPSDSGYDPLIRILNQLDNSGYSLDILIGKDEFILPVKKKMNLLQLTE